MHVRSTERIARAAPWGRISKLETPGGGARPEGPTRPSYLHDPGKVSQSKHCAADVKDHDKRVGDDGRQLGRIARCVVGVLHTRGCEGHAVRAAPASQGEVPRAAALLAFSYGPRRLGLAKGRGLQALSILSCPPDPAPCTFPSGCCPFYPEEAGITPRIAVKSGAQMRNSGSENTLLGHCCFTAK